MYIGSKIFFLITIYQTFSALHHYFLCEKLLDCSLGFVVFGFYRCIFLLLM